MREREVSDKNTGIVINSIDSKRKKIKETKSPKIRIQKLTFDFLFFQTSYKVTNKQLKSVKK